MISEHDKSAIVDNVPAMPQSRTEIIYGHIKQLIIEGKLKPNQRITIQELVNSFNVSTTPIREALQKLRAENLLYSDSTNRNELRVISLSKDDLDKVFELVGVLDVYGIKKYLKCFPEKAIQEIKKMHEELGEYYKKGEVRSYTSKNMMVHHKIWQNYQNEYLRKWLAGELGMVDVYAAIIPDNYYTQESLIRSYTEHCELMEAIERRNVKRAGDILGRHWKQEWLDRDQYSLLAFKNPGA
jgi:DNA-binding GntR family transcriptional regulator